MKIRLRHTGPSTASLTIKMPIDQGSRAFVDRGTERVRHCVIPVIGTDARRRPFLVGSAVALTFRGRKVLVTAEHLLSGNQDTPLSIFNAAGWSQPFGDKFIVHTGHDLAARLVLPEEEAAFSHIPFLTEAALQSPGLLGAQFYATVVGHPATASRLRPGGMLETPMDASSHFGSAPEPGWIEVIFDRNEGGYGAIGHSNLRKPTGKSGGAIFGYRVSGGGVIPRDQTAAMIGIPTTWNKRDRRITGASIDTLVPLLETLLQPTWEQDLGSGAG